MSCGFNITFRSAALRFIQWNTVLKLSSSQIAVLALSDFAKFDPITPGTNTTGMTRRETR
ncbi:hypothetical protein D3C86_1714740 [compost metagenome]